MLALKDSELQTLIETALAEDVPYYDLASEAIFQGQTGTVDLIAKQEGVLCGLPIFQAVFTYLQEDSQFDSFIQEGERIEKGQVILSIQAKATTLLTGERVALNYLQRLSGIATATRRFVDALEGSNIKLMDTRKTTPGFRNLEKYAVRVGGGYNHRHGLSDLIMLKDNHIGAAGSITAAVQAVREVDPFIHKIEVETENLDMVKEAVACGVDIIMLDNMDHDQMAEAIAYINGRAIIEGSGNMTADTVSRIKDLDLDYISSGSITHSAGILDLSMKNFRVN
ncbi:carboxylating nicotinate-nucleotide diphosphorylase [Aerococcus sanguinicola]|uniref:Probable nicotinate-nucleotide pyrophosphorylase [carboxylating] n=1 Tax=Aerococcus sanguinicola TaxID=119206 RepID=A0A0X8FAU9_9LACT|nr:MULTISPECIES: carboxylating nicotinate-nucleotide diphosphorylase [Aerococcus]AMB93933.1 nicotinate-nucleotide pyrophosphorylase [Aerococcus sanguinicola]MDK7050563.1 carboxylating nicotinate-nucleotide diphosphorylase [Aerococcus sanguinicola]OFT97194.1 nicotinate-nucleotide diphosphorylase (carboxylating) [Aerococcus sp. HMSC23C02]PKZ21116.1 nicotinate-nucleotide diphosphorylase (carboxylating) [Aerococcus sanguinicola]